MSQREKNPPQSGLQNLRNTEHRPEFKNAKFNPDTRVTMNNGLTGIVKSVNWENGAWWYAVEVTGADGKTSYYPKHENDLEQAMET